MAILYELWDQHAEHFAVLLGGATKVMSMEELVERLAAEPDETLVVFGPGAPLAEAVAFAGEYRLIRPALGVLLLRQHLDVRVLGEALRAGVREVVDATDPAAVLAACARSQDLSRQLRSTPGRNGRAPVPTAAEPAPEPFEGRVVTVFSAKGGCGKTTIATNLAIALAAGGHRRVCLVDLDLAFGDVAITLQLSPERTIADAIPVADRIDETGLRTLLTPYVPGVDTLLAPVQPAVADEVTRDLLADLLQLCRGMFDFVVVDTASTFNEQTLAALDASHEYILVATPELPALKNLRVTLDMFDLLDYRRENRIVVLNRADSKVGLSPSDIERVIRVPVAAHVPSSRDVPLSVNRGQPLMIAQPNHSVSAAIRELATSRLVGTATHRSRGLRGLMSRKAR
ncbi:MAG TPA: AAA family ATPase [Micromonosporaceae bacterium]|nr:AAA family ATPase [Micromonosporaceae bacterium]